MASKIYFSHAGNLPEADVSFLFDKYAREYPDELARWREIERDFKNAGPDPLADIQRNVILFLMDNATWDDQSVRTAAWMAIRKKVVDSVTLN